MGISFLSRSGYREYSDDQNRAWFRVVEAERYCDLADDLGVTNTIQAKRLWRPGVGGITPFFSIKEDVFHGDRAEPRRAAA